MSVVYSQIKEEAIPHSAWDFLFETPKSEDVCPSKVNLNNISSWEENSDHNKIENYFKIKYVYMSVL